jgi:hypothetical protein
VATTVAGRDAGATERKVPPPIRFAPTVTMTSAMIPIQSRQHRVGQNPGWSHSIPAMSGALPAQRPIPEGHTSRNSDTTRLRAG